MLEERKIIHIDMDCFYAAIEQCDFPELRGKPIGVGGESRRGVLCTASYEARKFGVRSAMAGYKAVALCPELILVPVRFDVYRRVSLQIRAILGRFSESIEPLSLDEAYLDVSHWKTPASAIAREIRTQIFEETRLTASAGVAPNKLLAKIASDLNKPNGQFCIHRDEVADFMQSLPVAKLWGVGKKMQEKLSQYGVLSCGDLQKWDKIRLSQRFGKWGIELYDLCRGVDTREVKAHRIRKSISKETTFLDDVHGFLSLLPSLRKLCEEVEESYQGRYAEREVKSLVVKVKFADFTRTTVEKATAHMDVKLAEELLREGVQRGGGKAVRLLGVGFRLADDEKTQLEMF